MTGTLTIILQSALYLKANRENHNMEKKFEELKELVKAESASNRSRADKYQQTAEASHNLNSMTFFYLDRHLNDCFRS